MFLPPRGGDGSVLRRDRTAAAEDYLGDTWPQPYTQVASSDSDTVESMYDNAITALESAYLPAVNRFKPLP